MKHLRQFCMGLFLVLALSIPALAGDIHTGVTGTIECGLTGDIHTGVTGEMPNGLTGDIDFGITGDILSLLLSLFA